MPRASRYLLEGYTYHLTHRCHDRRFLLKFAEEREEYREWLRAAIKRYGISVYAYCITSNHTHVVAHAHDRAAIAQMMHLPSGAVARHLNRRKRHEGSVWEHPYQCTMEECVRQDDQSQAWVVREAPDAYVADSRSKSPVQPPTCSQKTEESPSVCWEKRGEATTGQSKFTGKKTIITLPRLRIHEAVVVEKN